MSSRYLFPFLKDKIHIKIETQNYIFDISVEKKRPLVQSESEHNKCLIELMNFIKTSCDHDKK